MCTVSYIPSGDHFYFTSSRDEQAGRPAAAFPQWYNINGQHLFFPKDPLAGGSWVAVHRNGNLGVLLNGAVLAHLPQPPYRKSRGMILLDLLSSLSVMDAFKDSDFDRIEPFTVILFEQENLWCGQWDGSSKRLDALDSRQPHIWSSVTLYDCFAIQKRAGWFKCWLAENPNPSMADIIKFHRQGGDGDPHNDLLMNREGRIFTNSISSVRLSPGTVEFQYLDLCSGKTADHFMALQKTTPVNA
jgi:hypothetical protein